MRQVTRWISLALLGFVLAGCLSLSEKDSTPTDKSYYLLDTIRGDMCLGNTKECISLSIVASQNGSVGPIESAYNQKVSAPNYPRSLMNMLMKPNDKSYLAKSVDGNGRFYRIPKERKTDTAWRTMKDLYNTIYE